MVFILVLEVEKWSHDLLVWLLVPLSSILVNSEKGRNRGRGGCPYGDLSGDRYLYFIVNHVTDSVSSTNYV